MKWTRDLCSYLRAPLLYPVGWEVEGLGEVFGGLMDGLVVDFGPQVELVSFRLAGRVVAAEDVLGEVGCE